MWISKVAEIPQACSVYLKMTGDLDLTNSELAFILLKIIKGRKCRIIASLNWLLIESSHVVYLSSHHGDHGDLFLSCCYYMDKMKSKEVSCKATLIEDSIAVEDLFIIFLIYSIINACWLDCKLRPLYNI